jgi:hypothetical protein
MFLDFKGVVVAGVAADTEPVVVIEGQETMTTVAQTEEVVIVVGALGHQEEEGIVLRIITRRPATGQPETHTAVTKVAAIAAGATLVSRKAWGRLPLPEEITGNEGPGSPTTAGTRILL